MERMVVSMVVCEAFGLSEASSGYVQRSVTPTILQSEDFTKFTPRAKGLETKTMPTERLFVAFCRELRKAFQMLNQVVLLTRGSCLLASGPVGYQNDMQSGMLPVSHARGTFETKSYREARPNAKRVSVPLGTRLMILSFLAISCLPRPLNKVVMWERLDTRERG